MTLLNEGFPLRVPPRVCVWGGVYAVCVCKLFWAGAMSQQLSLLNALPEVPSTHAATYNPL